MTLNTTRKPHWPLEDIGWLMANYPRRGVKGCASVLRKSETAVRVMACRCKVSRDRRVRETHRSAA